MRPSVFLDMSLFAIPNTMETIEELDRAFSILEGWADKVAQQTCINIVVTDDAISVLEEAKCFPAIHNIQALLELYDLQDVFSARDINKRIFKILSRASSLQDVIGVGVQTCDAECSELELLANLSGVLLASAQRLACAVGIFLAGQPSAGDIVAIVMGFPTHSPNLTFRASNVVADIDGEAGRHLDKVDTQIRLCQKPKEFLEQLAAESVWQHADSGSELVLPMAIRAAEKLMIDIGKLPLSAGRSFAVGEHFYESLSDVEALGVKKHASTTLDRCATVIADNTPIFERNFCKVRRADNAAAKRVHLTKHGAGLRLMFWELDDGSIEFANVGVKAALEITEGDPAKAATVIY